MFCKQGIQLIDEAQDFNYYFLMAPGGSHHSADFQQSHATSCMETGEEKGWQVLLRDHS